jgi:hypothetical protein
MMMMMMVAAWKSCADTAAFPHAAAHFDTCFYASLLFQLLRSGAWPRYSNDDNPSTALLLNDCPHQCFWW